MPETQKKITFGDVWDKYDVWLENGQSSPRQDRQRYRDHLQSTLENVPLSALSPDILEKLKVRLIKRGLSPATVKHCLVIVRQVINKAIAWELWSGMNPVKHVKLPKLQNQSERYLTYEEAGKLIAALAHAPQTQRIAIVSLETGLRALEIRSLTWPDIDFEQGVIQVRGKGALDRVAYMTSRVRQALKEQPRGQSDFVFESRNGGQMGEISSAYFRAVDRLGLNTDQSGNTIQDKRKRVDFHCLRHTYASWLAIDGTPLYTIKNLLGHSSITMTERYAHLCPNHTREAAIKISDLWSVDDNDQENPPSLWADTESDDQL